MFASKSKLDDIQFRSTLLECMEIALRMYAKTNNVEFFRSAKELGTITDNLKHQIEHGDYAKRDARKALVDNIIYGHY